MEWEKVVSFSFQSPLLTGIMPDPSLCQSISRFLDAFFSKGKQKVFSLSLSFFLISSLSDCEAIVLKTVELHPLCLGAEFIVSPGGNVPTLAKCGRKNKPGEVKSREELGGTVFRTALLFMFCSQHVFQTKAANEGENLFCYHAVGNRSISFIYLLTFCDKKAIT